MRKLIVALAFVAAAFPAIATEGNYRVDEHGVRWELIPDQILWVDSPADTARSNEPVVWQPAAAARVGDGWELLDGWMAGDPTLRHWVIHRFDLDADGWLSTDEAMMARRAFYEIADTNRSELITSEEFVAGWAFVRLQLRSFYAVGLDDA